MALAHGLASPPTTAQRSTTANHTTAWRGMGATAQSPSPPIMGDANG
ncbi:hypothetical protein NKT77_10145 [Moraxella sp. FZLJ2107]|nr:MULTISPECIES: hypothetical protein [unclassified Moraxella]UTO04778.1 hypothetical protein NKT77_09790 [Moraxella sp. FZLJ2107]UTO04807.1 hypothetical protein NKT77_09935 [Moraxella sp. FZLJ2107]UTO04819.1 hypothetical protein NKT77_09995 [Moraxella sp. FZLJ2107]UTO04831.1 hypothetical protein NKT77_10055 [Moraxella sp. FZLJ2107]UTO04844.1 hypothetical protein NKT77_10120 [Moraxella sp. FZLJ2107]